MLCSHLAEAYWRDFAHCTLWVAGGGWRPNIRMAVRQLILIGCGPSESHYAQQIMPARLLRSGRKRFTVRTSRSRAHSIHPAAGVQEPLTKFIDDFAFVLLDRCGHDRWRERFVREEFFTILRNAIPWTFPPLIPSKRGPCKQPHNY